MSVRLHHPALVVPDLERARDFYCQLFGFECVRETHWDESNQVFNQIVGLNDSAATVCMLRGNNCYLELFEYSTPESSHEPGQMQASDCTSAWAGNN